MRPNFTADNRLNRVQSLEKPGDPPKPRKINGPLPVFRLLFTVFRRTRRFTDWQLAVFDGAITQTKRHCRHSGEHYVSSPPLILSAIVCVASPALAQPEPMLLKPARVFDGTTGTPHAGWVVLVKGGKIVAAGPADKVEVPKGAKVIDLPGTTLMPGLIDAHSHVLLHPYDETPWNDQVLKEPLAERICRATAHAKADLLSGFTTLRDLGTEGAGFADVGIKSAIEKGIIPGPRLIVVTKAIVATGSYARAGSPRNGASRRVRKRPMDRTCEPLCASKSARVPTGSRSTPIRHTVRGLARSPRSRSMS